MTILLTFHSIIRWLAFLAALAVIVRLGLGLVKKMPFDKSAAAITAAFGGMMDLQLLFGLTFFVIDGLGKTGFPRYRWEHFITMLLAVIAAHLPAMWKKMPDQVRTRNTLIAVLVSLLLVIIGIGPLGGWTRWWHIFGLF